MLLLTVIVEIVRRKVLRHGVLYGVASVNMQMFIYMIKKLKVVQVFTAYGLMRILLVIFSI